jgi:hypothetical protein
VDIHFYVGIIRATVQAAGTTDQHGFGIVRCDRTGHPEFIKV